MDSNQRGDERRRVEAMQRLEILDAFVLAVDRRQEVMDVVSAATDAEQARSRLRELFGLTEVQAIAVLDLQVRRFATRERQRIVDERDELRALHGLT